ncbi:MAG: DUF2238 domain-containing protein [Deltaproteobacteria bacterium]|nr:DUF2238 domain-containing protein [Deltaproteobacteria bacterium]
MNKHHSPLALLAAFLLLLAWSGFAPADRFTWWMEVFPALIGLVVLLATYRKFPLTPLAYTLIWLHAAILLVGGHYTYAEVPIGNWARDAFDLSRNHFDRLGHLAQGFVPAILAREVLLRRSPLRPGKWLFFLTVCFSQTVSAWYEFLEWWTALATGSASDAFIGSQGDPWDTQTDMFMALVGAVLAQVTLAGWHLRQMTARGWMKP